MLIRAGIFNDRLIDELIVNLLQLLTLFKRLIAI